MGLPTCTARAQIRRLIVRTCAQKDAIRLPFQVHPIAASIDEGVPTEQGDLDERLYFQIESKFPEGDFGTVVS